MAPVPGVEAAAYLLPAFPSERKVAEEARLTPTKTTAVTARLARLAATADVEVVVRLRPSQAEGPCGSDEAEDGRPTTAGSAVVPTPALGLTVAGDVQAFAISNPRVAIRARARLAPDAPAGVPSLATVIEVEDVVGPTPYAAGRLTVGPAVAGPRAQAKALDALP